MIKKLSISFIIIGLFFAGAGIAKAGFFRDLYDQFIKQPTEEIKEQTVGYVSTPSYFKKVGNEIKPINSSWGFIVGNTTSTNATTTGSMYIGKDLTVGGDVSMVTGKALKYNGVNLAIGVTAQRSYFFGNAGNLTVSDTDNTAVGDLALSAITSGDMNTAMGASALRALTSAWGNSAFGSLALFDVTASGNYNTAIGYGALQNVTGGDENTAIGDNSGLTLTTGLRSVFIGHEAGYYETGSDKLFIDNDKRASEADARTKALIYGVFAAATADQTLTINGNLSVLENATTTGALKIGKDLTVGTSNLVVNDGNVGIGTTSPSTKFVVSGNARISGLVSCDTIDTDSDGNLSCGTDDGAGGGISNLNSETLGSIGDVSTTTLAYGSQLTWDTSNWISTSTIYGFSEAWATSYNATTTLSGHPLVTITGEDYASLSGQQITFANVDAANTNLADAYAWTGANTMTNLTIGYSTSTNKLVVGATEPTTDAILWVGGDGYITGDLDIAGSLEVTGNATTTGQHFVEGDRVVGWKGIGATFSSSTLATFTGATTTIFMGIVVSDETWGVCRCNCDTGTTTISIDDGNGNVMGYFSCPRYQSDAIANNSFTVSTNNVLTANDQRRWLIGNVLGSPTQVSFNCRRTIDAD